MIVELKTDAMKDRHWKQLLQKLRIKASLAQLTLGHLSDANLVDHEPTASRAGEP